MTTSIPARPFVEALAACASCLERDPLRFHPGRMHIARTLDAIVLETATRAEKVRITIRIPCEPGDAWAAVLDADCTSRLAKTLRPFAGSKKNGHATVIEIERGDTSIVLACGGQRVTIPAHEPPDDEPKPPDGESHPLSGAEDLATRIGDAMTFCAPGDCRELTKGPFLYIRECDGQMEISLVVTTDGHRLYVDGEARDCPDDGLVFQASGESWKSAAKALGAKFDNVRLVRRMVPQPSGNDGGDAVQPSEKYVTHLVFEAADREVRLLLDEPQVSLPPWAGFLPREAANPDFSVTCDRDELARAVKAVSAMVNLRSAVCMLRAFADQGLLRLSCQTDYDGGMTQQELHAEVHGTFTGCVHVNPRYVLDALTVVRTERVRMFQSHSPLDSVRLVEVAEEGTSLRPRGLVVMPVRGNDPPEETATQETNVEQSVDVATPSPTDDSPVPVQDPTTEAAVVAQSA